MRTLLTTVSLSPREMMPTGAGNDGQAIVLQTAELAPEVRDGQVDPAHAHGDQDPIVHAGLFGFGGFDSTVTYYAPIGGPSSVYGDFDNDGALDHVTSNPRANLPFVENAGDVEIRYGGASKGVGRLNRDQSGVEGVAEWGDGFGTALAVGDFNGDGYDDLAVGVPGQEVEGESTAGAVHIFYGSRLGLNAQDNHVIHQSAGVAGSRSEIGDRFGEVLTVGDFSGDGYDDLAVGVPAEQIGGAESDAGVVSVFHGSSSGLRFGTNFYQDRGFVRGSSEKGDRFGAALVSADFNADGFDDLAVGVPGEDIELGFLEGLGKVGDVEPSSSGVVHVFYGTQDGLGRSGNHILRQGKDDVGDHSNTGDWFGSELTTGDFNGDGVADLAVGVPYENLHGSGNNAGLIHILHGSTQAGLSGHNSQIFTHDAVGISGEAAEDDKFGSSVIGGDFNGDGFDDLVIVVEGRDHIATPLEGELVVLYGTPSGLQDQTANGAPLGAQQILLDAGNHFRITTADFNNDGHVDIKMSSTTRQQVFNHYESITTSSILYGTKNGLSASKPIGGTSLASRDVIVGHAPDTLEQPDDEPTRAWHAIDSAHTAGVVLTDAVVPTPNADVFAESSNADSRAIDTIFREFSPRKIANHWRFARTISTPSRTSEKETDLSGVTQGKSINTRAPESESVDNVRKPGRVIESPLNKVNDAFFARYRG